MRIHVVTHTHWDREWYLPLGRFRQRLVALVDELLDRPPADGGSFLLDGQCIALEDYLAVRPERRAELAALLRDGRIEAGPWYVLGDELIPSGEALVRNLLAGRRILRALRADAPPVLYCPDSFGHPAALPALARGFGMEAVVAWRGYGSPRWPQGDAAWWHAPDGTCALLLHLPPDGYEFGSNLPADPDAAAARWARAEDVLSSRSRLGVVLLQNGADHHARQHRRDEAVAALIAAAHPNVVVSSSLRGFIAEALHAAHATQLPAVRGELRDSYGYTWTLQGTFGTRASQKRMNALCERLLLRDAEPWAALAWAAGGSSRRHLLDAAWRTLLECHPHDTLCGCSIDAVAAAADVRWADAAAQGKGVRADALHSLVGHDPAAAHGQREKWSEHLVIRNRAARPRGGLARVRVETFIADVGVGPSSAGQHVEIPRALPPLAFDGPHQVLSERVACARFESPRHYPDNDLIVLRDVLIPVAAVAGYGVACLPLDASHDDTANVPEETMRQRVRVADTVLSHATAHFETRDLVGVECARDAGDLYTPAVRGQGEAPPAATRRLVHDGPLHGAIASDWTVPPAGGGDISSLTTTFSLSAGEAFLRIDVEGVHRGLDQRIRLLLRTGIGNPVVWADAAFGAVERVPLAIDGASADSLVEIPPRTAPLHRYVSLFGGDRGATVYSDGLAEYEVLPDGAVAVTLVRGVGELSRHDLPERPGHAGWPTPVPAAQSQGPFVASLALFFHGGTRDSATIHEIERTADDVLLPLTGESLRNAITVGQPTAGVRLEGDGLAFSTLKESEDGAAVVLRCVNLLDEAVDGRWILGWPVASARLARLDETPLGPLGVTDACHVRFTAAPRAVVTILVR